MTSVVHNQSSPQLDASFAALRAAIRERDREKALSESTILERLIGSAFTDVQGQARAVAEANAQVVELTLELQNLMSELEVQNDDLRKQNGLIEDARRELELQSTAIADANVQAVLEAEAVREQLAHLESKRMNLEEAQVKLQERAAELSQEAVALASANAEAVELAMASEDSRDKAQAALREREEQLRRAQKMEVAGQVAGGLAHDFNSLLTAIIGQSGLILMTLDPEDPDYDLVSGIRGAGEKGAVLVKQMLAFCRCQELKPTLVCLNDVIQGIKGVLRGMLAGRTEFRLLLDDELGNTEVDRVQIEQVLVNLVANARDAMPQGGRLKIETANASLDAGYCRAHPGVEPGDYALLKVTDTGPGIDAETKEHIFEPFFTTKGEEKRSGLGLSTAFGIVKQSGGDIQVHSQPGQGASFEVYLPLVPAQDRELVAVSA